MAYYKTGKYLAREDSPLFDVLHTPGAATPVSGVYRCEACGGSAVSTRGKPLPSQDHHAHPGRLGLIRWRLVVRAQWAT